MSQDITQYLLLLKGAGWYEELSPQEIQEAMSRTAAWFDRLSREGKCLGGQPLEREGRIISAHSSGRAADGPFVESKESVGGYLLLNVSSLDEAIAVAQDCPMIPYGLTVEVRPVAPECVVQKFINQQLAEAIA